MGPVLGQLQGGTLVPLGGDAVLLLLALVLEGLDFPPDPVDVLPGGARQILEPDHAEGVGPQGGQGFVGLAVVGHQQIVALVLVLVDIHELRQRSGLPQFSPQNVGVRGRRGGAQHQLGVGGALLLQGQIQLRPGQQVGQAGLQLVFRRVEPGDLVGTCIDLFGPPEGGGFGLLLEKCRFRDGFAFEEQSLFGRGILVQGLQGTGEGRGLRLALGEGGGVPPQQGGPLRVRHLVFRF